MVHRAPDSRLLTNLIANEKAYSKHFANLFPISHAALASLSAYAAASPSAQTIANLVDLFANADDALQRYNSAIQAWRDQLQALNLLEDDLAAILRDRDILVTRIIKASKATRDAHRSSRLTPLSTVGGSASFSSLPSINTISVSGSGSSPTNTNAKLAQAQAELRACEAHLIAKERELDARRASVVREGLGARCRALIDCGWVWGEVGKQGLKALQMFSAVETAPLRSANTSEHSSLTPSQSASQTAAGTRSVEASLETRQIDLTLPFPPAHAISDLAFPTTVRALPNGNGLAPGSSKAPVRRPSRRTNRARRPPSHIPEVDEGSDDAFYTPNGDVHGRAPFPVTTAAAAGDDDHQATSSSDEEDETTGPLQIVDNDPLATMRKSMHGSMPHLPTPIPIPPSEQPITVTLTPSPPRSAVPTTTTQVESVPGRRQRRTSMALFGSIRGLFRKPKERGSVDVWEDGYMSASASVSRPNGHSRGWVTRTDARMHGHLDSDEELGGTVRSAPSVVRTTSTTGGRLRKGRPRGTESTEKERTAAVGGGVVDGWTTDGVNEMGLERSRTHGYRGTTNRRKTSVADLRGSDQGHTDGEVEQADGKGKAKAKGRAASGDVRTRVEQLGRSATATATASSRSSMETRTHRRSASVDYTAFASSADGNWRRPAPSPPPPPSRAEEGARKARPASVEFVKRYANGHNGRAQHGPSASLMSLVVDGSREVKSMDVPRAPRSVLVDDGEATKVAARPTPNGGAKMPLRSALRNASRTPSPVPIVAPVPVSGRATVPNKEPMRDSMSISSYETGRESMSVEVEEESKRGRGREREREEPVLTIPPPPSVDPPDKSVTRRKSVRVSLQPTFSPTPPAVFDASSDSGGRERGKSKKGKGREVEEQEDMWADSASEEEVYRRARGLLNRSR